MDVVEDKEFLCSLRSNRSKQALNNKCKGNCTGEEQDVIPQAEQKFSDYRWNNKALDNSMLSETSNF